MNSLRKILARIHASSVQTDISRFLLTDIGKKETVRNQLGQTLIKPIRQTQARKILGELEKHQVIPSDRFGKRRWETLQADTD